VTDPDRHFTVKRHTTRNGIVGGALSCVALYAVGYFVVPPLATAVGFEQRLRLALWLCGGPALFVYAVFFSCLRYRDTPEAVNPLLGNESLRWKINQRVLTNTVEQVAIFVPLLLALAARIDDAHVKLLPLHVALWLLARVVFWVGYRIDPALRAPGFSATHVTTILTIAWLMRFSVA
jgi:hypothetical protein